MGGDALQEAPRFFAHFFDMPRIVDLLGGPFQPDDFGQKGPVILFDLLYGVS
jgi:hypothetical protein